MCIIVNEVLCLTRAEVFISESSNDTCQCKTELILTVPPCLCTDTLEAVRKANKLKEDVKFLQDECITANTNLTYACKLHSC